MQCAGCEDIQSDECSIELTMHTLAGQQCHQLLLKSETQGVVLPKDSDAKKCHLEQVKKVKVSIFIVGIDNKKG